VWKTKLQADGSVGRYKARLVVKGYQQREGIDYNEVFAPVLHYTTLRAMLALAAANDMHLHLMDVKSAFLNGDIGDDVVVFMEVPPTLANTNADGVPLVCRLKKTLYGLKQSPRAWASMLTDWLLDQGFTRSEADPCLYIKDIGTPKALAIGVFVDDLICAASGLSILNAFKASISARFKMTDQGELTYVLGLQVDRDRSARTLFLSQHRYTLEVLDRFGMLECRPVGTPLVPHTTLGTEAEANQSALADVVLYSSVVGSLMYLATCTRPDISAAVGQLARHMAKPMTHHLAAAKHVLRYLAGTRDLGITYTGSQHPNVLTGYADADFAGDLDTRRSTTGNLFLLNGAAISWISKRQTTVSTSTAEAEYTSLFTATQEAVHLRYLLADLGVDTGAITIFEDNQPAIHIATNPVTSSRSKHFDVRLHYTREKIRDGTINVVYVATSEMLADLLTKGLDKAKTMKLRSLVMGPSATDEGEC
jgi:hypothetical protein